jgi:hypothetical protein
MSVGLLIRSFDNVRAVLAHDDDAAARGRAPRLGSLWSHFNAGDCSLHHIHPVLYLVILSK